MNHSLDKQVQSFLDTLQGDNKIHYDLLQKLREIVFDIYPDVSERFIYGGIMFTTQSDFGGLYTFTNHISFIFSNGYQLQDPDKILEGGGKFRRHIKMNQISDIQNKKVQLYVKQAIELSNQ